MGRLERYVAPLFLGAALAGSACQSPGFIDDPDVTPLAGDDDSAADDDDTTGDDDTVGDDDDTVGDDDSAGDDDDTTGPVLPTAVACAASADAAGVINPSEIDIAGPLPELNVGVMSDGFTGPTGDEFMAILTVDGADTCYGQPKPLIIPKGGSTAVNWNLNSLPCGAGAALVPGTLIEVEFAAYDSALNVCGAWASPIFHYETNPFGGITRQ